MIEFFAKFGSYSLSVVVNRTFKLSPRVRDASCTQPFLHASTLLILMKTVHKLFDIYYFVSAIFNVSALLSNFTPK